jgi:hypothetical protein
MRRKKASKRSHSGFSYPKHLEPRGGRGNYDDQAASPREPTNAVSLTERLIEQAPPTFPSFFIDEPKLVFGNGELCADPKTGISAFGPIASGLSKRLIRIGIIGTGKGIDAMRAYLDGTHARIEPGLNSKGKLFDPFCFPDFPGIDKSFRVAFETEPRIQRSIPLDYFKSAVKSNNPATRLRAVVDLVIKELGALAAAEPNPDVVVIVMPPEVEEECKIIGAEFAAMKIRLTPIQKIQRKFEKVWQTGQELLGLTFDEPSAQDGQTGYWNIHHALKAHAMSSGLTTQVAWESTLRGHSGNQDPASTAWNLLTALYYKSGNIPWQLERIPQNTCFVGVSFYKESPHPNADMQSSLAQVFSGAGEGLVLKGERAVVDRKRDRKAHLTERGAEELLGRALATYEAVHQNRPTRVVIHKTSRYWPEECAGFNKALGSIRRADFLALEHLDHQFMRCGKEPPLRGTVVSLTDTHHVIYTQGYIPFLRTYPGMRIPNPLEIVEHHGDSSTAAICQEILALTKVNWNSCFFGSSVPITIRFAKNVGKILAELPSGVTPQTKYKFYM